MALRKPTVLFSGMIAGDPHQGGATWSILQYLLGFQRLGCEVLFVEPVKVALLRPQASLLYQSVSAAYFRQVSGQFGLEGKAALLLAGTTETVGLRYEELLRAVSDADIFINVSGMLADDRLTAHIPVRVYLDLDPAFNQLWHATQGIDMHFSGHSHFVTVGQAIGGPECTVPTCGMEWIPTLQPVVLAEWPAAGAIVHDGFTTVGNWRGYGSIEHEGTFYGQKAHSLRQFIGLPRRTNAKLMPALGIHPEETRDLTALRENGWILLDPAEVARDPRRYREFIQGSRGEFGIAKSGYVASRCGWFSDRSACYLASGRPVLAQETGFNQFLPTGEGLIPFETEDDVLAGIDALRSHYPRHARAARSLAEEYFDSDKVLTRLLERIGAAL
jgi:hypothetical protein